MCNFLHLHFDCVITFLEALLLNIQTLNLLFQALIPFSLLDKGITILLLLCSKTDTEGPDELESCFPTLCYFNIIFYVADLLSQLLLQIPRE